MKEGLRNETMLREGYRNYDSPVAMPGEFVQVETPKEKVYTLDEYFAGLHKLMDDTGKTFRNQQVGGSHYQQGIQPWDVFLEWGVDPWTANVVKYILRFPYKDEVKDLEKAKHYIEYLIRNYDEINSKYYLHKKETRNDD